MERGQGGEASGQAVPFTPPSSPSPLSGEGEEGGKMPSSQRLTPPSPLPARGEGEQGHGKRAPDVNGYESRKAFGVKPEARNLLALQRYLLGALYRKSLPTQGISLAYRSF